MRRGWLSFEADSLRPLRLIRKFAEMRRAPILLHMIQDVAKAKLTFAFR